MFVAMNRFRIHLGREEAFEDLWRNRQSRLAGTPGFVAFHVLRGGADAATRLYVSHSVWTDRDSFTAWTRSDAFREAHRNAGAERDIYAGPPVFEGFEAVDGV